jgi:hypothetical protein
MVGTVNSHSKYLENKGSHFQTDPDASSQLFNYCV